QVSIAGGTTRVTGIRALATVIGHASTAAVQETVSTACLASTRCEFISSCKFLQSDAQAVYCHAMDLPHPRFTDSERAADLLQGSFLKIVEGKGLAILFR